MRRKIIIFFAHVNNKHCNFYNLYWLCVSTKIAQLLWFAMCITLMFHLPVLVLIFTLLVWTKRTRILHLFFCSTVTKYNTNIDRVVQFLADVNSRSRSLYAIADPSVCRLSVTLVRPTQPIEIFGNFFLPYHSPGTLVFWCQNSLVGDAPFPLNFSFKVTHPLSNSAISTNIGS